MAEALLTFAIIVLCLAHVCKVLRWRLFVEIYEEPYERNLLQALAYGYLINFFLPLKAGDIFRAVYAGRKMKNRYAFAFSTVIVDRYLDVIAVGILFFIFYLMSLGGTDTAEATRFYTILAAILLGIMVIAFWCSRYIKKCLKLFASIFNENIEFHILKFSWALIWNFKDIFYKINKLKIFCITIGMWLLYIFSYYLFALSLLEKIGKRFEMIDVFLLLFSKNSIDIGTGKLLFMSSDMVTQFPVFMTVYMIVPLLLLLMISCFRRQQHAESSAKVGSGESQYLNLLPHLDKKERLYFLENYFSDDKKDYISNYLKINQGISIIRDYSAGSNATTLLCLSGNRTFFRKYAFDLDGEKLYEQVMWLKVHNKDLPLTEILNYEKTDNYCYYDMAYDSACVPLFNYVHSMPWEKGWAIIETVLEKLESSIYSNNCHSSDPASISQYIEDKVEKNLKIICNARCMKNLLEYDKIIINGVAYKNLYHYTGKGGVLDKEILHEIIKDDVYADIHGDLTIENIICMRRGKEADDYYIIDPNTGNIHESPNLDYAKLLQFLHGGYEFMMAEDKVMLEKNQINFMFTRSSAYVCLYRELHNYMKKHFYPQKVKSIYCHEVIHWLRLLPYKINKDTERVPIFFAGLLMVLSDVEQMVND